MKSNTAYKIYSGSLQERFHKSRAKIQLYGGGFANGKTAAVCIKTIQLAKDYPGANILMARSTFPKLNDTLRKEFFKWLPEHWIQSFTKVDNTLVLTNGTTVNFRYVAQQGKSAESTTSNLLSATYDLIVVDQMEDPEITEKDFNDLLGRLRGMARYDGDDKTMPDSGPRWMILTCNPTRNWVYRKLVKPLHDYKQGRHSPDLIVHPSTGEPLVELFEGSTYENRDNLEPDFIETLEATYQGQMRDRFLLGLWAAYEGLVYPQFDEDYHVINSSLVSNYYMDMMRDRVIPTIIEGYDHGIAVPSCYLLSFVDKVGNVIVCDGFYVTGDTVAGMAARIKRLRRKWAIDESNAIYADPALFRRTTGSRTVVGETVAGMYEQEGIRMKRGANNIIDGISKVQGYLSIHGFHKNPVTASIPAPYLYISDHLSFVRDEFTEYYWKRDPQGDQQDKPVDKNDHALDTIKYMLTDRPAVATMLSPLARPLPDYMRWHEYEERQSTRKHRYS